MFCAIESLRDIECSKSIELVSPSFSLTTTYIVNSVYLVYHQDTTNSINNNNIIFALFVLLGQFFRKGVDIDEARRLLQLPNMQPVPVMRKPIWHFMEQETPDEQLCWVAMNPGYQGKKLIEGSYLDYVVDDLLSMDFNN